MSPNTRCAEKAMKTSFYRQSNRQAMAFLLLIAAIFASVSKISSAQELVDFEKTLPATVVELGDLKSKILNVFNTNEANLSVDQRITEMRKIGIIEARAIAALKAQEPAAVIGLPVEDLPRLRNIYLNAAVGNSGYLAEILEGENRYEEAATVRELVVGFATEQHGAEHWKTNDAQRRLAKTKWLRDAAVELRTDYRNAVALKDKGAQNYSEGKNAEALAALDSAAELLKKIGLDNSDDFSLVLFYRAKSLAGNNQPELAEAAFQQAVEFDTKTLGADNPGVAQTLYALAVFYRSTGQFQKGIDTLERSQQINRAALGENSSPLANDLLGSGILYSDLQDYAAATTNFSAAFQMLVAIGERNSRMAIDILNNQQTVFENGGALKDAETISGLKVEIGSEVYGRNSLETATFFYNHGVILRANGKHDAADEQFTLAKAKFEKFEGYEKDETYITLIDNMAQNYRELGDLKEAEKLARTATEMAATSAGKESLIYAIKSQNLAIILGDLKQHAEAEQRFLETLEILKKIVGTDHREYFTTRSNLGDVFRQQGKFAEAIAIWEETNEQKRKHYGDRDTIYLNSLNMLAEAYEKLAESTATVENAEKAKLIRARVAKLSAASAPAVAETNPGDNSDLPNSNENIPTPTDPPMVEQKPNQPLAPEIITELQTRLDAMIAVTASGDVEKILDDLIPPDLMKQFKDSGEYDEIRSGFAENKLPILIDVLKSVDVKTGELKEDTVHFNNENLRPMSWKKIDGKWYINN